MVDASVSRRSGGRQPPQRKVANMERAVFVYTTYPSVVEAERAGRALVEQHLCACVNILPGMISHYRWQGTIERGEEVVMIIKTRSSLAERVSTAVKEMHSYATPALLVIPIESVDRGYLDWLMAETAPAAQV
jgi:periplasmic divalent cation tolerance protein